MEQAYGFDKHGVDAIRDTVNAVLGAPLNMVGQKRAHRNPGGGGRSSYAGPFAVVDSSTTTDGVTTPKVTVCGYQYPDELIGLRVKNRVCFGSYVFDTDALQGDEIDLTNSASCHISLIIEFVGWNETTTSPDYTFSFGITSATNFGGDDTIEYVPLAYVEMNEGQIQSITQIQYGYYTVQMRSV